MNAEQKLRAEVERLWRVATLGERESSEMRLKIRRLEDELGDKRVELIDLANTVARLEVESSRLRTELASKAGALEIAEKTIEALRNVTIEALMHASDVERI